MAKRPRSIRPPKSVVKQVVQWSGGPEKLAPLCGVDVGTIRKWMTQDEKEPGYMRKAEFRNVLAFAIATRTPLDRLTGLEIPNWLLELSIHSSTETRSQS